MPRRARIMLAGVAAHLIERGNNRGACFLAQDDYRFYLHHLHALANATGCAVHAAMVAHPRDYRWSSYCVNAEGEASNLIVPNDQYRLLGRTFEERCRSYRGLFKAGLGPGVVTAIRQATNGNCALGTNRFQAEIEAALGRRAHRGKPGRPKLGNGATPRISGIQ
jgi:hypothetical protein